MRRRLLAASAASAITGLLALTTAPQAGATGAASAPDVRLGGDVIPGLSAISPSGPTDPTATVQVDLVLADPNAAAEKALVAAQQTPASPEYHSFLTPAQYAARFGLPAATVQRAEAFATAAGLKVAAVSATGTVITLSGTIAQVEHTFSVDIANYSWHGVNFFANTAAPAVPADLGIAGVVGLNSAQRSHTFNSAPAASAPHGATPAQDTCDPTARICVGVTTPTDLRSVYDAPAGNTGQGQKIGMFGAGAFSGAIADLRLFEGNFKLPQVPVRVVLTQGGTPADYTDASGSGEWDLDIQSESGMAPGVSELDMYFAKSLSDADVLAEFANWAGDPNGPLQMDASFGECEYDPAAAQLPSGQQFQAGQSFTAATEQALTQANAEGRTLFASSGDTGSSCPVAPVSVNGVGNEAFPDVNYPCASPEAVCVGGTVLYTKGGDSEAAPDATTHASRVLEYSWTYTGGGSSFLFHEPGYQKGVSTLVAPCLYTAAGAPDTSGTACRGVPDIAAQSGDVATNGYAIYTGGTLSESGGTSLSSPLNVGLWALVQAASTNPQGNGFANRAFYAHPKDFFDIGGGASSPPTGNGYFVSTPGWDYTSGLGTPDVAKLAADVSGGTAPAATPVIANPGSTTVVDDKGNQLPSAAADPTDPGVFACLPLFTGAANQASFPSGVQSQPQLDILQGDMHNAADGSTLTTVLTIQNMAEGPTAVAVPTGANEYYFTWSYGGTTYFTNAQVAATGTTFTYGLLKKVGTTNQYTKTGTATGVINDGPNGTITITVPTSGVGSPKLGDTLTSPAGSTEILAGTTATGGLLEPADAAGPHFPYILNERCAANGQYGSNADPGASTTGPGANLPEAPLTVGVPLAGLAIGGLVLRRRRRSSVTA